MKTKQVFIEESDMGVYANHLLRSERSDFFGKYEKLKFLIFICVLLFGCLLSSYGQTKKDGSPDMRYRANKETYGNVSNSYSTSTNSSVRYQNSYTKSNGTSVQSHYKTTNNNTNWDNYSSIGNKNPHTGTTGSRAKDYTPAAQNYGSGKEIYVGPKGGQYYKNDNGNKVYVPKR